MTRGEIANLYFESLPYPPYPVQEEAMLAWFTADQGVLVCAPTGTGKTLIAQAALFEALHTRTKAYYTTPLIALTEQKFQEMRAAAERWGFSPDDVGLITGNRKLNPDAPILIVVAEILLNRLLHPEGFDFSQVSAVVMDEFHSFADIERGIVWELSLNLLPPHVRLLLLSATVGNSAEFVNWLDRSHGRKVELVESRERKIPLTYQYIPDKFLGEFLVEIAKGDENERKVPALVFCFNRDECWSVAEMLKGLDVMAAGTKAPLNAEIDKYDWPNGVGPKLKTLLRRGVGVHHAGLLPFYRRAVEDLFEKKLLSVAVCTETLAAGINLPARSVVLTSLVKGPFGKEKFIEPSVAHQIFGRAGRPQFDTQGFVYALAHEDDVRLVRWKRQYDQIPEDTKDPVLLKKKKELKKKKPDRNSQKKYWTEATFEQLQKAPPGNLYSKGPLPWRLLAYLLKASPEVGRIRTVIRKRLLDESRVIAGEKQMERMLLTLHEWGFVTLEPTPVKDESGKYPADYKSEQALPNPTLDKLLAFRSIHPIYGAFLIDVLGKANWEERVQIFESVLDMPRPMLKFLRPYGVAPGPLETEMVRPVLEQHGLLDALPPPPEPVDGEIPEILEEEEDREPEPWFAEKLRLFFETTRPETEEITIYSVWAAGELLRDFAGNFNLYILKKNLAKQEGIIFRHLLRLILLCEEFAEVTPADTTPEEWLTFLKGFAYQLTESCRAIDPTSTSETIRRATQRDSLREESSASEKAKVVPIEIIEPKVGLTEAEEEDFLAGLDLD
ncbi:MAG: DEAD/DEAH box helicase [Gemmataceae bacterium]|jgi:superfamily II DNA/RNA helicase|nr:DEAD/DEAH box helicase [Gemmataceae bacterium]